MKRNLGILLITMIFITVLSSCEKKDILKLKTVWGIVYFNTQQLTMFYLINTGFFH